MGMIAEKLIVLWPVLLGGAEKRPPCSFHTVLQAAAYRVKTYQEPFNQQKWGSSKNDDLSLSPNGKTIFQISVNIDS